ncbi:MAG TPA: hypothetical protein ENJ80_11355 [Gammaproteobacteria bacterium]|nr:hypothetical protein [Gammaproteobacteria bacterium]
MSLSLPPKSVIRCDEETAQSVHEQLTSVIAGHPQATTTYRFYEEIDSWLGPWGQSGYPIAYGKFYNIAFSGNQQLMANPAARQWVWRTTIFLQEALRDYIVRRVRDCTLPALTEAELRQAAFDSHPRAYDRGGLATLVLVAPELIPVIATIPAAEFSPTSSNFSATVRQVFVTLGLVVPRMTGIVLAASAGPAHTGVLSRAVRQDQQRLLNQFSISRELGRLKDLINQGKLDHIPWLNQTIAQLNARQFPDQGFARLAREVIQAAQSRRRKLLQYYDGLLNQSPEVRSRINRMFPDVLRPVH